MNNTTDSAGSTGDSGVPAITLTPAVIALLEQSFSTADLSAALRISVLDGGCSGKRYVAAVEQIPRSGDGGSQRSAEILYDPDHAALLDGVVVDHDDRGFRINSPHQKGACACGASFTPRTS